MQTLIAATIGCCLLAVAGCASQPAHPSTFASWEHMKFSIRSNWNEFVGWAPVATPNDTAQEQRQGGWWGEDVPVWTGR